MMAAILTLQICYNGELGHCTAPGCNYFGPISHGLCLAHRQEREREEAARHPVVLAITPAARLCPDCGCVRLQGRARRCPACAAFRRAEQQRTYHRERYRRLRAAKEMTR